MRRGAIVQRKHRVMIRRDRIAHSYDSYGSALRCGRHSVSSDVARPPRNAQVRPAGRCATASTACWWMSKGDTRRWLLVAASFAATLGISAYILWSGWAKSGAPPAIPLTAHALAFVAVLAEILTRTIKIQWSGAALRIPLGFGTALRVCLGGDFGASITPSRTGAEPARFLVLAEAGVPPAGTLLILFTELFLEMTSLCLLCAILAAVFRGSGQVVSLMTAMIVEVCRRHRRCRSARTGYFLARRNAHGEGAPNWCATGRAERRPLAR